MDNNTNNNISGIPNVSDIKFDDTPAESFDNLYGNGANSADNRPMASSNISQGPTMVPNPDMNFNSGIGAQPSPAPVQPAVNPAPVQPAINPAPVEQPAVNPAPVAPAPVQPTINPAPVGPTPVVNPTPVQPTVNPVPVQPAVAPMNAQNSGTVGQDKNLSDMVIDDEKMQSIEEQLSKTSQYNPADFQQEQITIPTDNEYEKNKSAASFLIVLLIIVGVFLALLPQLTKMIG